MMMALRNSPSEYALINALDGANAPRRPSKALVAAIGVSVALHLGLFTYLYLERIGIAPPLGAPAAPVTIMGTVRLPPEQPPKSTHPQPRLTSAVHNPVLTPLTPPVHVNPFTPTTQIVPTGVGPISLTPLTPPQPPVRMITDPKWLSQPTA